MAIDVEFFLDVGCPFTWQTSVWIRRVAEIRGINIGWRFLVPPPDVSTSMSAEKAVAQTHVRRYHRLCAAAGDRLGNDAIGALYRAWGERLWYTSRGDDTSMELAVARACIRIDAADLLRSLRLPMDLLAAADDDAWDAIIERDSAEALRRTGPGLGSPVITFGPPAGNSLFGPVVSSPPDDDVAVAFYDAVRMVADYMPFSELKRTTRTALDLPLMAP